MIYGNAYLPIIFPHSLVLLVVGFIRRFVSLHCDRRKEMHDKMKPKKMCRAKNQALKTLARTAPSWSIFFRLFSGINQGAFLNAKIGMYNTMCKIWRQLEFSVFHLMYEHIFIYSAIFFKQDESRRSRFAFATTIYKSILNDFI